MHKKYEYTSVFADFLNEYIQIHRDAGFKYDNPAYWLYRFDQYCVCANVIEPVITKTLFNKWGAKSSTETKTTQNNRLQALRGFSIYINSLGFKSYIPTNLPKPEKVVPYLMTDNDICEFFEQIDLYKSIPTFATTFNRMAQEYKVLFRLIYCCGLRNNEACSLKIQNVDLINGCITLHNTKGNKERIVYLSTDLQKLCSDYLKWLLDDLGSNKTEWLFPGRNPDNHILKTSVDRKFNEFWNSTNASKMCKKKPTVHCLRHAFVIKRINLWIESGVSINVMMPYLSNYLGHKGPIETYYYYYQIEDIFKTIRRKDTVSLRVIPEVKYED